MTRLSEILDQMTTVLNDLKTVMDAEQQQLSVGQINGSQLQRITEEKSSLLATLDIWNNSAVWSRMRSVAQTMTLQSAGRRLPKKRSIFATSTSTTAGCWKGKSSVINRRWRC